jgi:hypothetical protein
MNLERKFKCKYIYIYIYIYKIRKVFIMVYNQSITNKLMRGRNKLRVVDSNL